MMNVAETHLQIWHRHAEFDFQIQIGRGMLLSVNLVLFGGVNALERCWESEESVKEVDWFPTLYTSFPPAWTARITQERWLGYIEFVEKNLPHPPSSRFLKLR